MTVLRHTLRTADDIVDAGLVTAERGEAIARVAERYAIAITPAMAELIDRDDHADPIARQFIPDRRELETHPAELADPIGDHAKSPVKGIVHRYRDRVLLKIVGVCPVYCRFCFRREMVGPQSGANLTNDEIDAALHYIRAHSEIWEVILTGGDPMMLSPRRAAEITEALSDIRHVKVLRWHTRIPVVAPERITDDFVAAIASKSKTVFVALHSNHPRELTPAARSAIARLV
ncbi:MAG: radical SAM protein, partial [Gammaproteobacteria bacterium]